MSIKREVSAGAGRTDRSSSTADAVDYGLASETRRAGMPQLHSLMAFESIARHGGLAPAARELGVTRSALSHSISLLEHRLQVRLFRQMHPTVMLSEAGKRYLIAVQHFARTLGDSLYRLSADTRTTLRLEVSAEFSRLWLGARLPGFHALHPRIDLNVTLLEASYDEALQKADLVLGYGVEQAEDVLTIPLWRESIVALAAPALARKARQLPAEDLPAQFPLIEIQPFSWRSWLPAPYGARAAEHARYVTRDVVFGLEMAANGFGIALGPRQLAHHYLKENRLASASTDDRDGNFYQAMTLQANASRLPVAAFLSWLAEELPAGCPGPEQVNGIRSTHPWQRGTSDRVP